jgi:hypothetical protein
MLLLMDAKMPSFLRRSASAFALARAMACALIMASVLDFRFAVALEVFQVQLADWLPP